MPVSSYQVQRLLRGFRRIQGKTGVEESPGPDADQVQLTRQAAEYLRSLRESDNPPQSVLEVWPDDLADRSPLSPLVEHELERRAGSFMDPPLQPVPPAKIPKMKR